MKLYLIVFVNILKFSVDFHSCKDSFSIPLVQHKDTRCLTQDEIPW